MLIAPIFVLSPNHVQNNARYTCSALHYRLTRYFVRVRIARCHYIWQNIWKFEIFTNVHTVMENHAVTVEELDLLRSLLFLESRDTTMWLIRELLRSSRGISQAEGWRGESFSLSFHFYCFAVMAIKGG